MQKIKAIEEASFSRKNSNGYNEEYDGYVITLADGNQVKMGISNGSQCCENWGYLTSEDNLSEFVGAKLKSVTVVDEKLESTDAPDIYEGGLMFINIDTTIGLLQFVAYNEHNGYYSHDAVLIENETIVHQEYL